MSSDMYSTHKASEHLIVATKDIFRFTTKPYPWKYSKMHRPASLFSDLHEYLCERSCWPTARALLVSWVSCCIQPFGADVLMECGRRTPGCFCVIIQTLWSAAWPCVLTANLNLRRMWLKSELHLVTLSKQCTFPKSLLFFQVTSVARLFTM